MYFLSGIDWICISNQLRTSWKVLKSPMTFSWPRWLLTVTVRYKKFSTSAPPTSILDKCKIIFHIWHVTTFSVQIMFSYSLVSVDNDYRNNFRSSSVSSEKIIFLFSYFQFSKISTTASEPINNSCRIRFWRNRFLSSLALVLVPWLLNSLFEKVKKYISARTKKLI